MQDKLTPTQIKNFIQAASPDSCSAIAFAQDDLNKGKTVEQLFKKWGVGLNDKPEDRIYGYYIKAEWIRGGEYYIKFGCQAGPNAGDGAEWECIFDEKDKVISCEQSLIGTWIS